MPAAAHLLLLGFAAFCATYVAAVPCYCSGWGDPHYTTYDGNAFDFYGVCKYLLTGNLDPENGKPLFEVYGKNEPWGPNPTRSVTEYVEVKYCGQVIRLGPGLIATLISPPGVINPSCFTISISGGVIYLTTDFGLKVGFMPTYTFYIWTPGSFSNLLTGICGDCNGNAGNDITNPTDVTNNYLVYDPDATNEECIADQAPCEPKEPPFVNLNMFCGFLLPGNWENNPFAECLQRLGADVVASFHRDCVVDVSASGCSFAACDALKMVIGECMALGFYVDPIWTDLTGCRECPPHVKSREEALTSNNAGCDKYATQDLKEYIFCEDPCSMPQYTCQLKKEFHDGFIYETCKREVQSVVPFALPNRFNCEPCTCECDESLLTMRQVYTQVPSGLCSVEDVAIKQEATLYHVCSGSCQNKLVCLGSGEVIGTRYLKCEGVEESIEQKLYKDGVKCDCKKQSTLDAEVQQVKNKFVLGGK